MRLPSGEARHSTRPFADGWNRRGRAEISPRAGAQPELRCRTHWYSHCLVAAGRFDEALSESGVALALDPMNVLLSVHLAWHHYMAREHDLVLRQSERVVQMEPHYHWGHYFLAWGAETLVETGRAVMAMRNAVDFSGNDPVMIAGLARAQAAACVQTGATPVYGLSPSACAQAIDYTSGRGRRPFDVFASARPTNLFVQISRKQRHDAGFRRALPVAGAWSLSLRRYGG